MKVASHAAALISAAAGAATGIAVYALVFYASRSGLVIAGCALGGALCGLGLMRLSAALSSKLSGREARTLHPAGAAAVLGLLLVWAAFPLHLALAQDLVPKAVYASIAAYVFASLLAALFARGNIKTGAAVFFAVVIAIVLLSTADFAGKKVTVTPLPGFRHERNAAGFRVITGRHSRIAMPLSVGKPLNFASLVPDNGVIEFELGVTHPDRALPGAEVLVSALPEGGPPIFVMRKSVPRGRASWTWHSAGLSMPGGKALFKFELITPDPAREDYQPVYIANVSVFKKPGQDTPNVVVLLFDAMRADALGCYGGNDSTPEIDGLAQEGVLFERAISPSSWTMPAVASILTSKYPSQQRNMPALDRRNHTLAELLALSGVRTGAVVANYVLWPHYNYDKGFQDFFFETPWGMTWRNAERTAGHAIEWAGRARRPFFLYVHVFDPHHPHMAPPPYGLTPSASEGLELLRRAAEFALQTPYLYAKESGARRELTKEELSELKGRYLSEVSYADSQAGRIARWLKGSGLWDNTLLIITSDHGEEFLERGHLRHGNGLHRELVQVPLIFTGGPVENFVRRVEAPVSTLDIMPTVLELQGARVPEDLEGVSLLPLIKGEPAEDRPVFSELVEIKTYDNEHTSVLSGKWRLIKREPLKSRDPLQMLLYDWSSDPEEKRDLSGRFPEKAAELTALLDSHFDGLPGRRNLKVSPEEMMAGLRDKLRALGYVK